MALYKSVYYYYIIRGLGLHINATAHFFSSYYSLLLRRIAMESIRCRLLLQSQRGLRVCVCLSVGHNHELC